ncbi:MbnP family protein [Sphingobacterium thalpophilum]|uniref:AZL_007920/MXAN_0976 family protein n=1 Tax=Sphingobacterium thalpophilum TaxID=259 RepID=A0A4U9UN58_9SPHI|nr:MbnP family protein [Sphingobacterium thalpophilum]VTR35110.1 AZL_007920/MXAN_0976 family protein [Sphingobacterium thalpophilum]
MKSLTKYFLLFVTISVLVSCSKDDGNPVANNITLHFNNTFKNTTIVLGDATSSTATANTSAEGQVHHFSELKYVISNIRLIKADGGEIPYNINDLDKGATVVNHSKPQTLDYVLSNIPVGEYRQIKFGLGVKPELNTLDEARFPNFYAEAGANDTEMMWEWGAGYRFTKIEGFYDTDNKPLSIHTGSTVEGTAGAYTQGVDAYRDINLTLPTNAVVGRNAPRITINADFDKLLSGKTNTIKLTSGTGMNDNATPNIHTAVQMVKFVDNVGGNGSSDMTGMFSIGSVNN